MNIFQAMDIFLGLLVSFQAIYSEYPGFLFIDATCS